MSAIRQILDTHKSGHGALVVTGRSLYDFVPSKGKIRPLFETLRRDLYQEFGMVFCTFSKANGLHWFESWIADEGDRRTVREALQNSGLLSLRANDQEMVAAVRAAAALVRTNTEDLKWSDGRRMRFCMCFEFAEHFAPCTPPGGHSESQLVVIELVHIMSQSLALRDSGNLILFHGRKDLIDDLVTSAAKLIDLPPPDLAEKEEFIAAALDLYEGASFEEGLTPEGAAALTKQTPNRGLENLLRASDRNGRPLTIDQLVEQKDRDVKEMSEGTLRPLDTTRVDGLRLVGKNVGTPLQIVERFGERLLERDPTMPANVLLAGAPATAKTDLALHAARLGQCPAYQMMSPKAGLVGETERLARLQQDVLRRFSPAFAFIDEITEAFPLERSEFNGDSGASDAVRAELLTCLSDQTRCGQTLLVATTNCIWKIGAAMRSRFIVIPVLTALPEDIPSIIAATADRICPGCNIPTDDERVISAARIFHAKGATPRHIRTSLSNTLMITGKREIDPDTVLLAADDLCQVEDTLSGVYADLQAIRYCTSKAYLPWAGANLADYTFPEYLKGLVDETNGDIIGHALLKKIEELKPYANV
ncbi:MAG: AAA family ATPase [Chloracidobacterium sp.]|nr:AAA family ATPase [Chloracidobacterium sp.]